MQKILAITLIICLVAFFRLGVGNIEKGIISNVHTPTFNIDESAIEIGMGVMAWMGVVTPDT